MRNIKFRGKRIDNGDWVYGYYVHSFGDKHYIIQAYSYRVELWDYHEVQSETVGQFTGLHDKDGKEIYEGDVLCDRRNNASVIIWDCDDTKFLNVDSCEYILDHGTTEPAYIASDIWVGQEVIGNIHDNPELL